MKFSYILDEKVSFDRWETASNPLSSSKEQHETKSYRKSSLNISEEKDMTLCSTPVIFYFGKLRFFEKKIGLGVHI